MSAAKLNKIRINFFICCDSLDFPSPRHMFSSSSLVGLGTIMPCKPANKWHYKFYYHSSLSELCVVSENVNGCSRNCTTSATWYYIKQLVCGIRASFVKKREILTHVDFEKVFLGYIMLKSRLCIFLIALGNFCGILFLFSNFQTII